MSPHQISEGPLGAPQTQQVWGCGFLMVEAHNAVFAKNRVSYRKPIHTALKILGLLESLVGLRAGGLGFPGPPPGGYPRSSSQGPEGL